MRFVPFSPEHAFAFEPQGAQKAHVAWMTPDIAEAAAAHFSFSAIDDAGRIVGCAGIAPTEDALVAWALFSERLYQHRFAITRAVRMGLDLHRTRRVVAHVHVDHAKAARFAEALDFRWLETRADLHPSGSMMHVYVRDSV